ncbi:hypothetical protein IU448_15310 [Nocardia flavorosea]|uniref:hypothetical protein n=1 Tax=Nocardia flavorosea TaxID=53429 RepID=UPI00189433F4|nr:hypothetical protein [Nocardia flavorosea]MBF6350374.1 hypothetical protein [Nocardia flavorosea]
MPKISGLGLGEIKKVSGLGLGNIRKVSGLGLGLIWQSISQLGMTKNGAFLIQSSYGTVTGWTPDAGTTLSGDGILVTTAGTYTIQTNLTVANSSFLNRDVTLRLARTVSGTTTTLITGTTLTFGSSGSPKAYPLSHGATAYSVGDIVTLQADSSDNNDMSVVTGGTIRMIPAS